MEKLKIYALKAFRPEMKGIIRDLRGVWVMEELGLKYDRISLDSEKGENKTPEYLRLNPLGKVPTLQDGDFSLYESAAICQYLAEKHGKLMPAHGSPDYFTYLQWCYWVVTNLEPQCSRVYGCDFFYEKNETTAQIRKMATEILSRFFPLLEGTFAKQETMMKSGFGVVDVLLMSSLTMIEKAKLLDAYPNIQAYVKRMAARPAYQRALEINGQ